MKKKLLCGILAALMLLPLVACTQDENPPMETDSTETPATTVSDTESTTEQDTEPETEPPLEIEVPDFEDIGLASQLPGTDGRINLRFNFADYKYNKLLTNNALVFTSNKDYTVDAGGLSLSVDGWNSVGFAHTLTEQYTAQTHLTNRGTQNNVRAIMFGCRVTRSDHLYIDSGLWFTFSERAVFAHVKNGFTELVGNDFDFNAKDGLDVTIKDDGTTIQCIVNDQLVASAVVDDTCLTLYNAAGDKLCTTPDLARIAHGDTLGYVRTMSHFADSTTEYISLETGAVVPYAPNDSITELRSGYSYLLCDKTQIKAQYPVTIHDGVTLLDAKAAAALYGFKCTISEDGTQAKLTREGLTLTFTTGSAQVDFNGTLYNCPTTVSRKGVILIAVDYLARWMGYTVTAADNSVYISASANALTDERKQAIADHYQLYADVIYNYDDVEIEQTGVGKYETTPYEDRLVGIAYSTWLCTKIISWGKSTWDTPLYGNYYSDDREMIAKHAELLRDAGVDFIFIDWTNNTAYDPETMRDNLADFRMIEDATDLIFEIWSQIEGAPKVCIFAGPGHSGIENVENGNHQKKVDQIYRNYVEKYPDLYFQYEGKPLLMCYGATPNQYGSRPKWTDDRFTIRWVTGYLGQQSSLINQKTMVTRNQWWSWEERGLQPFSVLDGRVECVTCTAASRGQGDEGDANYIPAYGRENGLTLKKQFQRANDLGAGMVILVSWNEWTKGEQPSPEISKDLEPSVIHGTFYYDLLCEQIKKFKGQINTEATE